MSTVTRPHISPPRLIDWRGPHSATPSQPSRTPRHFIRRRLALAAGLLLAVIAIAAAAVWGMSGSDEIPPATGAAALVPADALAYLNLSIDSGRPVVADARTLAARFPDWPLLETAALNRLRTIVAGSNAAPADFAGAVRPWIGKEAALALISSGASGAIEPLVVLAVARPTRAQAFVRSAGASAAGAYDGARLEAYPTGSELAFVGHYLVAGSATGVRAAIDAAAGRARKLSRDPAYDRAVAGEPADRVLDAYLSATGVHELLATRTRVGGAIGLLLDRPSLQGTAISVSPTATGARVLVHSVLGATAPVRSFTPTLQSVLPSGSTLMLDVDGLDRAAPALLEATATAGIAANVGPLLQRVGTALRSQGVNLRSVLSLFDGETAVALGPGTTPSLVIVARVQHQATAQGELAALEGPVTGMFSASGSGPGQVPELADQDIGGVAVHEIALGPGLQVDYGVWDGLVVVSTSLRLIDDVFAREHSLDGDPGYRATLPDQPGPLSSLVFGDVSRLLALGEQTGLTSGARTRELVPDLSQVHAIGLSSTSGERDTTTELNLQIP
ncbi:MAG: DUF3352 domain-containing protein [Solirubrobacterales bacterium]|nr:DUF3352 domain-containing protein [Solirubrobacterales bacterium]